MNKFRGNFIVLMIIALCFCFVNVAPSFSEPINSDVIYTAYEENLFAADELYKGKKIEIIGKISNIGRDVFSFGNLFSTDGNLLLAKGTPYIVLGEKTGGFESVWCFFNDESASKLSKFKKGDMITIKGNVAGWEDMLERVIIRDCSIFSPNDNDSSEAEWDPPLDDDLYFDAKEENETEVIQDVLNHIQTTFTDNKFNIENWEETEPIPLKTSYGNFIIRTYKTNDQTVQTYEGTEGNKKPYILRYVTTDVKILKGLTAGMIDKQITDFFGEEPYESSYGSSGLGIYTYRKNNIVINLDFENDKFIGRMDIHNYSRIKDEDIGLYIWRESNI